MRPIEDEKLLDHFRRKERCEWCGHWTGGHCHPHHLWTRGMGGGGRLDIAINLIAVCFFCHVDIHSGRILFCDLLAKVAAREDWNQQDIRREIARLRRTA